MDSRIRKITLGDEAGTTIHPATTTDAVIHPKIKKDLTGLLDVYDVSSLFPNGGSGGSDRYTLELAIGAISRLLDEYKMGIILKFVNMEGSYVKYEYKGSSSREAFISPSNWEFIFNPPIGTIMLSGMGNVFGPDWERCTRLLKTKEWNKYKYSETSDYTDMIPISSLSVGSKIVLSMMASTALDSSGKILVSENEGETWDEGTITGPSNSVNSVIVSVKYLKSKALYIGLLVYTDDSETAKVSPIYSNNGKTWEVSDINPWANLVESEYPFFLVAGENHVVALGNQKAYITNLADGSRSEWTEESFSFKLEPFSFIGFDGFGTFDEDKKIFVVTANELIVTRSDNPGGNWEQKGKWVELKEEDGGIGRYFYIVGSTISVDKEGDQYIISNLGGVFLNKGRDFATWEQVVTIDKIYDCILNAKPSKNNILVASGLPLIIDNSGIPIEGSVYYSIDGGKNWIKETLGIEHPNIGLLVTPNDTITFLKNGIYKSEIPEIDENGIPYGYMKIR